MFGIGGTELFIIALVALLLLGPDKVPEYARKAGKVWAEFKKYQATMEAVIRGELDADDSKPADIKSDKQRPVAPPATFEDDEDDEEEEE